MHPFGEGLQEEVGPAAGGAGVAEEGTGEPVHWEVWGESGGWRVALWRWVCPVLLRRFVFTWGITGVNGNSAVVLMWDTLIRE